MGVLAKSFLVDSNELDDQFFARRARARPIGLELRHARLDLNSDDHGWESRSLLSPAFAFREGVLRPDRPLCGVFEGDAEFCKSIPDAV